MRIVTVHQRRPDSCHGDLGPIGKRGAPGHDALGDAHPARGRSVMKAARVCTHLFVMLALPLSVAACDMGDGNSKVLGSIDVASGSSVRDATTVNGAVRVGANAKAGDATTVNGSVTVAGGGVVGDATTVNGSIRLEENAVARDATTVNGSMTLAPGATVGGKLTNVNGHIAVTDAHVGGGIETANGNIDITGKSVVDGGITVKKPKHGGFFGISFGSDCVPRIVIGPGATVNGPLTFERKVNLYISDQAHVSGTVSGATAVKFSGDTPPASPDPCGRGGRRDARQGGRTAMVFARHSGSHPLRRLARHHEGAAQVF